MRSAGTRCKNSSSTPLTDHRPDEPNGAGTAPRRQLVGRLGPSGKGTRQQRAGVRFSGRIYTQLWWGFGCWQACGRCGQVCVRRWAGRVQRAALCTPVHGLSTRCRRRRHVHSKKASYACRAGRGDVFKACGMPRAIRPKKTAQRAVIRFLLSLHHVSGRQSVATHRTACLLQGTLLQVWLPVLRHQCQESGTETSMRGRR